MIPSPQPSHPFQSCPIIQPRTQCQEHLLSTLGGSKLQLSTHQPFRPYPQSEQRSKWTVVIMILKNPKPSRDTRMLREDGYRYSPPSPVRPLLHLILPHPQSGLRLYLREDPRIQSQTIPLHLCANYLLRLLKRRPNRLGQHYPMA